MCARERQPVCTVMPTCSPVEVALRAGFQGRDRRGSLGHVAPGDGAWRQGPLPNAGPAG